MSPCGPRLRPGRAIKTSAATDHLGGKRRRSRLAPNRTVGDSLEPEHLPGRQAHSASVGLASPISVSPCESAHCATPCKGARIA